MTGQELLVQDHAGKGRAGFSAGQNYFSMALLVQGHAGIGTLGFPTGLNYLNKESLVQDHVSKAALGFIYRTELPEQGITGSGPC